MTARKELLHMSLMEATIPNNKKPTNWWGRKNSSQRWSDCSATTHDAFFDLRPLRRPNLWQETVSRLIQVQEFDRSIATMVTISYQNGGNMKAITDLLMQLVENALNLSL